MNIKMANTTNTKDRCPRCGKGTLVTDANTGENFCGKCGFVITDKVEESGPEWRSFSNYTCICFKMKFANASSANLFFMVIFVS